MTTKINFFYDYIFPHTILPNATPVEMGIINYIHSIYSNKSKNGGLFTQDIETQHSPLKTIFNNSLGAWPTSLGGVSHLQMPCYYHVFNIKENSVQLGRKTNRYVYPIKVTYHFDEFTGFHHPGNKLNGEFFWKHISTNVLNDLYNKNALILLDWANESLITKESFEKLHIGLKLSKIPKEQIVLVINSFNAEEIYNNWFSGEEQQLTVKNLPYLMSHTSYFYNLQFKNNKGIDNFYCLKNTIRKYHYLFKIRRARDYRIALLYKLASDNLLIKGNWSCLDDVHIDQGLKKALKYYNNLDTSAITLLHNNLPHTLDCEKLSNFNNVNGWCDSNTLQYDNSYFYIASETYMTGQFKFVTEKIFKPIANFQPFVFLSFPGALKELKHLGFKTFHPYIDESYDDEQDEIKRFNLIYSEIERLCSMGIKQLHDWYWKMEDILIYNHKHLLSLYQNEPYALELAKYLEEKTS
jgi:hypothetical protein